MSRPECINLEARFGKRYRIAWEQDGEARAAWPLEDRHWLQEIRGRYGLVHPKGGELLTAVTDRPRIGAKLRALPFVLEAYGDEEVRVTFHVDHVREVFKIIKPYRRRQPSEAERERLRAMGERFRFGHSDGVQAHESAPESTNAPSSAVSKGETP